MIRSTAGYAPSVRLVRPKAMRDLKVRGRRAGKTLCGQDARDRLRVRALWRTSPFIYPLYVILSLLGLPESDFPRMLKLTQEMFGGDDAEHQRGETPRRLARGPG